MVLEPIPVSLSHNQLAVFKRYALAELAALSKRRGDGDFVVTRDRYSKTDPTNSRIEHCDVPLHVRLSSHDGSRCCRDI